MPWGEGGGGGGEGQAGVEGGGAGVGGPRWEAAGGGGGAGVGASPVGWGEQEGRGAGLGRGDFLAQSPGQWGAGGKKMLRVGLGKRKVPHRQGRRHRWRARMAQTEESRTCQMSKAEPPGKHHAPSPLTQELSLPQEQCWGREVLLVWGCGPDERP